jgi:hypothetical protein
MPLAIIGALFLTIVILAAPSVKLGGTSTDKKVDAEKPDEKNKPPDKKSDGGFLSMLSIGSLLTLVGGLVVVSWALSGGKKRRRRRK